jgi:2-oxoglutarate ferredoxin oxidoreductase subunit delta
MASKGWIEVNETYCKGCELCKSACPPGVIGMADHLTPKGYHPAELIAEGCTGCGICTVVCPDAAITVFRELSGAKVRAAEMVA